MRRLILSAIFSGFFAYPLAAGTEKTASDGETSASEEGVPGHSERAAKETDSNLRAPSRPVQLPRTRWQHRPNHALWTRSALAALQAHGQPLVALVPGDIDFWCPAYPDAEDADRRAFWTGFLSALSKYESTYRASAVGGGGRWFGLLQISPGTARGYGCRAGSGRALQKGAANLSCAIRILAETVPRDGVIHGYRGGKGQGVTADWGPMHSARKRAEMAGWLKRQAYCKPIGDTRPVPRP